MVPPVGATDVGGAAVGLVTAVGLLWAVGVPGDDVALAVDC
jgi:hypothetical protein